MKNIITSYSKKRILHLVIINILLIFLIGIVGNILLKNTLNNWQTVAEKKIKETEIVATKIINNKYQDLTLKKNSFKLNLSGNKNFEEFNKIVAQEKFSDNIIAIKTNDSLVYWNKKYPEKFTFSDSLDNRINETFFLSSGIYTYLYVIDTITINNRLHNLYFAEILEKHFRLNQDYFNHISLAAEISQETGENFQIGYLPNAPKTKDGRKYSFHIKNNKQTVIGTATFIKPSREEELKGIENFISTIQGLLVLLSYLLIGYFLISEIRKSNLLLRLFVLTVYFILLRYLFILIGFPSNVLSTELLNPRVYFSSFGSGLANSPLDLFITLVIVFIIIFYYFKYSLSYSKSSPSKNRSYPTLIFNSIIAILVYIIALRGIGAVTRGLVFDTSIRYFHTTSLDLDLVQGLMHINSLLVGLISILVSASLYILYITHSNLKRDYLRLGITLIILFSVELIYTGLQTDPQLTISIKLFHIIIVSVVVYLVLNVDINRLAKSILFFLAGSIFSIISLLFYNSQLEQASLKTTASIISKVDDYWYKNIIKETLVAEFSRNEAVDVFSGKGSNFNSSAFKIWSKSRLQTEAINSSVNFISLSGDLLGGFGSIYPELSLDKFIDTNNVIEEIQIFEEPYNSDSQKLIRGIFPVKDEYSFLGYLDVSILSDLNDFGFSSHPEFISAGKLNEKAILKLDKLIILDYRDEELKMVYGNINPSPAFSQKIVSSNFTRNNDAWQDLQLRNFDYIVYTKKSEINSINRIIAVALRQKELSIELFDFFKIFFTHSIILIFIVLGYFLFKYNQAYYYQFNLRTRLLIAFLLIALLPLILTAYYFRNLTDEKNSDAIYYKLGKRAFSVESYLNENFIDSDFSEIYSKASNDLDINYSVFRQNELEFSSYDLIYDIGLMPKIIHPEAYSEIILRGSQDVLVRESIDDFAFDAFYYKANFLGDEIIIKVTDGLNKIRLPLSGSEVDVFLFGIYSLAVVLIILFSAIIANQISSPIRKITSATKSVAAGDLSLELKSNARGELGELVNGFKYMIKELKRNQTILAEIEREEAWKEMAKQVAHEIKNPLTPMKLSVQQLITAYDDKSDKFDGFFTKVTNTILNQIETLKNIATEFSNFARMPKLKVESINCVEVINQSINLFTDENIKINFEHELERYIISGDYEQLKRTLINLIRNSIQANATEINFSLTESEQNIYLMIIDNGTGIEKEYLEKIFETNFTTKLEGMGLGLSMARRYLRSTGGDIFISKSTTDGTEIKITFIKVV